MGEGFFGGLRERAGDALGAAGRTFANFHNPRSLHGLAVIGGEVTLASALIPGLWEVEHSALNASLRILKWAHQTNWNPFGDEFFNPLVVGEFTYFGSIGIMLGLAGALITAGSLGGMIKGFGEQMWKRPLINLGAKPKADAAGGAPAAGAPPPH